MIVLEGKLSIIGRRGLGPWHAACIALSTGCLYTAPVWRPEVNLPPEIVRPEDSALGEVPLIFVSEPARAVVIATDPELEALEFIWQAPLDAPVVSTYPQGDDLWVSVLTLDLADVFAGDQVRVTVLDDNPRAAVDVVWRVEVPQ